MIDLFRAAAIPFGLLVAVALVLWIWGGAGRR